MRAKMCAEQAEAELTDLFQGTLPGGLGGLAWILLRGPGRSLGSMATGGYGGLSFL